MFKEKTSESLLSKNNIKEHIMHIKYKYVPESVK